MALECAGFLTGLGFDATVMARSVFLRGFDQQMASNIVNHMTFRKTNFIQNKIPKRIEKLPSGKLRVWFQTASDSSAPEESLEFDTVLAAIGWVFIPFSAQTAAFI